MIKEGLGDAGVEVKEQEVPQWGACLVRPLRPEQRSLSPLLTEGEREERRGEQMLFDSIRFVVRTVTVKNRPKAKPVCLNSTRKSY